jgi:hypothetical protein
LDAFLLSLVFFEILLLSINAELVIAQSKINK